MVDETKADSCDSKRGRLIVFVIFVIGVLIWAYNNDDKKSADKYNSTRSSGPSGPLKKEWYEGGTLHKAKISEWRQATPENKLATCGDFIAHTDKEISLPKAYGLVRCIDEAIKGNHNIENSDVSQIAAMCIVLIENQK